MNVIGAALTGEDLARHVRNLSAKGKYHALDPKTGRAACNFNVFTVWCGTAARIVPKRYRCKHKACRVLFAQADKETP